MWNCVVLLVTVYIICVDAVPLYGSIENSTIYSDPNIENISTPVTNHDAENLTTVRTNQISANITDHATKDDVSSTAKDESIPQNRNEENITTIKTSQNSEYGAKAARNDDFNTFWGNSLPSVLKKVSEFGENDKDAVIVYKPSLPDDLKASPSSYSNEDGVNNENNNQQATDDPEDYHPFQDLSGLGTDGNDTFSEEEWDADYNPADYELEEDVTEQNEAKSNYYKENNHTTPGPDEAEKNMKMMPKNSANKINTAFGSTYVIVSLILTIQVNTILD